MTTAGKKPNSVYKARRKLLLSRGTWQPWVSPEPARAHAVQILNATGMSTAQYAALAGIAARTLVKILAGPPACPALIQAGTATAVCSVTVASVPPGASHTDAAGTRRRLQALACNGWSLAQIAARAGLAPVTLQRVRGGEKRQVTQDTANAVTAVYLKLWLTRAPERTRGERMSAARARRLADRGQWAPGASWDDIDNPAARPHGARRLLAG